MTYKVKYICIKVQSSKDKKTWYNVERFGDGKEACNCRGWQMTALKSAETGIAPYCKHLDDLAKASKRKYVKRKKQ